MPPTMARSWAPAFALLLVAVCTGAPDAQRASTNTPLLAAPAHPPIVFVPGAGGSELIAKRTNRVDLITSYGFPKTVSYQQGDIVWLDPLGIALHAIADPEYFGILRLDDRDPCADKNDFGSDGQLVTLPGAYNDVVPFLTASGYALGKDLFVFTYDWRTSVLCHVDALDRLIASALSISGAGTVDLVAHSQGTLLVRSYLRSPTLNRTKLNKIVLLAGPSLGTPTAAYRGMNGECLWHRAFFLCILPGETVQHVMPTLPGALELLPSSSYYGVMDGRDSEHPIAYVDRAPKVGGPPPAVGDLDRAMERAGASATDLAGAHTWHRDDGDWVRRAGPNVSLAVGTGRCTVGQVSQLTGILVFVSQYIDGDGTVVRQSAALMDEGRPISGVRPSLHYRPFDHGGFVSKVGLPLVLQIVASQDSAPGGEVATPPPSLFCPFVVEFTP